MSLAGHKAPRIAPERREGTGASRLARDLGRAFTVLTVVPLLGRTPWNEEELPRSAAFFPAVGAALGALLWGAHLLLGHFFAPPVRAALLLALLASATGGLHLDGLADTCDGVFSRAPRERALEIMRQGSIGAFGAAGLVMTLLLKFALLASLQGPLAGPALLVMPAVGRQAMVLAMHLFPGLGPALGLGRVFARRVGLGTVGASLALTGLTLAIGAVVVSPALSPAAAAVLAAGCGGALACGQGVAAVCARRLGGLSGDVYGAINEAAEVAFLLTVTAAVRGVVGG